MTAPSSPLNNILYFYQLIMRNQQKYPHLIIFSTTHLILNVFLEDEGMDALSIYLVASR